MWFSLSKLAWQGLPRRGNTFPLEHNALAFAITPADRNGANNPSGLTPVFERKGFCTFFPLKGTLSALSGYPIFCPTGHLWSSLLTEDVVGAPSPLRQTLRSARSWQTRCLLHHSRAETGEFPGLQTVRARLPLLVGLKVVRGGRIPGVQKASCQALI